MLKRDCTIFLHVYKKEKTIILGFQEHLFEFYKFLSIYKQS